MNRFRLGFLLLFVFYASAPLANEMPPDIMRSPEQLQQVVERYSVWLKETGIASPALGWEVNVAGLAAISCADLSPEDANSVLHMYGIDCTKPDVPKYILRLNFKHPEKTWHKTEDGWGKLNESFRVAHGVDLDERLIIKISHLLSTRAQDIRISMETSCKSWQFQFYGGSVKRVMGHGCKMAEENTTMITSGITQALKDSSVPSSSNSFGGRVLTGELVLRFLDAEFGKKGATVKRLGSDSNYVSVIVEGLRGEVIEQQKYWERLQAFFFISEKGNAQEVRLLLDGHYAAGMKQPPLSAYYDMEKTHSKSLQLYATSILERLKTQLATGELK